MRRDTERQLREIHGSDVELIEMEGGGGSAQPTGRSYKVVKPNPFDGWPVWARLLFAVVMLPIAVGLLIIAGLGLWAALWLMWQIVTH